MEQLKYRFFGKELRNWLPHIEGYIAALAIDESDELYVLSSLKKTVKKKIRGKLTELQRCSVFNMKGKFIRKMQIDALKEGGGS